MLGLTIGGATVAEHLQHAIDTGALIEEADGTLRLPAEREKPANWATVANGPQLGCKFLLDFLFRNVYARSAVPHGCRACYKVKAAPRTLRELVAAWEAAKTIECRSKWGIDLDNCYSQHVYAGYFFATGLDGARAIYKLARGAFDADAKLGPDVPLSIKRGCSEYEAILGPSDRYEFAPELAELESCLKLRFRAPRPPNQGVAVLANWIDFAFRIGDDTYLDFTDGKRLRPADLSYDPEPSSDNV